MNKVNRLILHQIIDPFMLVVLILTESSSLRFRTADFSKPTWKYQELKQRYSECKTHLFLSWVMQTPQAVLYSCKKHDIYLYGSLVVEYIQNASIMTGVSFGFQDAFDKVPSSFDKQMGPT